MCVVRKRSTKFDFPPGYIGIKRLGEGSDSVVWAVRNEGIGEELALKISTGSDPSHRLQREFAILKRLDLPGIARVKESGQHEGRDYFIMELIDGQTYVDYMAERSDHENPIAHFLEVFQKALVILSNLHKQGIVHIDIKPSNLLITKEGEPVLLDFGFAEDYILSPTAEPSGTTLDYAAPELFTGGAVSPAADMYSLGVMAYEVLSGRKLWEGLSARELIAAKLRTPKGLGKKDINLPSGLEILVLRMLNPDPGLRPSAAEVLSEISWLSKGKGTETSIPVMIPRLVFGGRDEEMAELEHLVFDERRVVLLNGESGMGKTRLLRELRFKALVDGKNVLHIEGRSAHISLVDYISSALGVKHPEIDSESQQRPDKWSRYERVFQSIEKSSFDGVFIDAPVDLTAEERGLLGYLSRGFDTKLGLILSQVTPEVHPQAANVELSPLDEDKVRTLVERTFGQMKGNGRLSDTLVNTTQGNPRRMNELLDILYTEGWLSWERGWLYESKKSTRALARKLERWLGDSIGKLDKNSRMILDMLALVEGPLPAEVIGEIVGEDTQMVIAGLTLLRSFLHLDRPHYELGNDLIKPYLLSIMTEEYKQQSAEPLAKAMEEYSRMLWGKDMNRWDKTYLSQVGFLFFTSGFKTKAAPYLVSAGRVLRISYDIEKAREVQIKVIQCECEDKWKKEALQELLYIAYISHSMGDAEKIQSELIPLLEDNPEEKAQMLCRSATIYSRLGFLEKAELCLKESEKEIPNPSPPLHCNRTNIRGWIAHSRGKYQEAKEIFKEALEMASSDKEKRLAHQGLLRTYIFLGKNQEALYHANQAIELMEKDGDWNDLCQTLINKADVMRSLGMSDEIGKYISKALTIAENHNHPPLIAMVLESKGYLLFGKKQYREAVDVTRKAIDILIKVNNKDALIRLKVYEAQYLRDMGDWQNAQEIYSETWLASIRSNTSAYLKPYHLNDWAVLFRFKGEYDTAFRILEKAKKTADALGNKVISLYIELEKCQVCIDRGDLIQAKRILEGCNPALSKQTDILAEGIADLLWAELYLCQGEAGNAYRIYREMMNKRVSKKNPELMEARVIRSFGNTLIALDKTEEGLSKLREAIDLSKAQENPFEQGLSFYAIAEALLKHQGYSDEAASALEEAQTIFERLGAKYYLNKIKDLRLRFGEDVKIKSSDAIDSLENIRKVNEIVNTRLGKDDFLNSLLAVILEVTHAERGMIFIAQGDELHTIASYKIDSATACEAERISSTILYQMRQEMKPVYTEDATLDERFNRSESILLNQIRSFICVPLKIGERIIGTVYLDGKLPGLFNAANQVFFETLGNLLATSIDKSVEYNRFQERTHVRKQKSLKSSGVLICNSTAMRKLGSELQQLAKTDVNILLEGETGTGKGVLARMIHDESPRKAKEFCSINCGILPENVFESELFGTRKGAYTGATQDRMGLLEAASGSTVFFDEITNTSLAVQAKLLEVIEEKLIRRMGETRKRKIDLRFVFATNGELEKEVKAGRFREDLYFRISTVKLRIPPLREHKEDIEQFVEFFTKKFSADLNKDIGGVDDEALELLLDYPWTGNVRELRSAIERAVILAKGALLTVDNFELQNPAPSPDSTLVDMRNHEEKGLITKTLVQTQGNVSQAARKLGISRRHLYRLMDRHGIPH